MAKSYKKTNKYTKYNRTDSQQDAKIKEEPEISKGGPIEYIGKHKKQTGKAEQYVKDQLSGKRPKRTMAQRIKMLPVIRTVDKEPKTISGYANKGFEKVTANEKYQQRIKQINATRKEKELPPLEATGRLFAYGGVQRERFRQFTEKQGIGKKQWVARGEKAYSIGKQAQKTADYGGELLRKKEYRAFVKGGSKVAAKAGYKSAIFGAKKSAVVGKKSYQLTKYAGVKAAGLSFAATRSITKNSAKAMSNLSNAAERVVASNRLLAILKPMFWYIKMAQLGLSKPMPFIYAGIIIGIGLMVWFYGIFSGYYALYFLKALPAMITNAILSILNTIWFGTFSIYNTIVAALITIINQIAYFFIGGLLDYLHTVGILGFKIGGGFQGIPYNVSIQPGNAFAYYVPDPLDISSPLATLGSLLSFTKIPPGANPYQIDYSIPDAPHIIFENQYTQNGATLRFPKVNKEVEADSWWCTLKSRPPDINYSWETNKVGYILKNGEWTYLRSANISFSIIDGFTGILTSDLDPTVEEWFTKTGQYGPSPLQSAELPRGEMIFRTVLNQWLVDKGYKETIHYFTDWTRHGGLAEVYTINVDYLAYLRFGEWHCWMEEWMLASMGAESYLSMRGTTRNDRFENNVPWAEIYEGFKYYIETDDNSRWIRDQWPKNDNNWVVNYFLPMAYIKGCNDNHKYIPTLKHGDYSVYI